MPPLNDAFAQEFHRVLNDRGLTVTAAAELLGVSRQTFHSYLTGKSIPRPNVQAKAAELWQIGLNFREVMFDSSSFGKPSNPPPPAQQMEFLFAKLDSITVEDLHVVDVKREGMSLKVDLRIDIPA